MSLIRRASIITILVVFLWGCSKRSGVGETPSSKTPVPTIYSVNYPLKYFADRIGGEHVNVVFPVPLDENPSSWTPDAEAVYAFQQADLILLNGAGYAKWVPKVTLPSSKLINTTKDVDNQYISVQDAVTHRHGPGEDHAHEGIAFTTWLDPEIALAQASTVHSALVDLRPAQQSHFDQNLASLRSDLEELNQLLRASINKELAAKPVIFSRPVFQYLERRYGLNARSIHWEPDAHPPEESWAELQELLDRHPANWMIWESKPLDETAKRLMDLRIQSVVFDPCPNTPDQGDWLEVMKRNTERLAQIYLSTVSSSTDGS